MLVLPVGPSTNPAYARSVPLSPLISLHQSFPARAMVCSGRRWRRRNAPPSSPLNLSDRLSRTRAYQGIPEWPLRLRSLAGCRPGAASRDGHGRFNRRVVEIDERSDAHIQIRCPGKGFGELIQLHFLLKIRCEGGQRCGCRGWVAASQTWNKCLPLISRCPYATRGTPRQSFANMVPTYNILGHSWKPERSVSRRLPLQLGSVGSVTYSSRRP